MRIRTLAVTVAAIGLVGTAPASVAQAQAQGQLTPKHRLQGSYYWQQAKPPEPKQEPTPEAKPATAASLVGKWSVNVEMGNGPIQSALEIKADPKDAKKVTGTIASQAGGETTFEGEVVDGKLTFWFSMNANGNDLSVTFVGALQKDGSLAGTLSFGQGEIPWTAIREKK